MAGGNPSSRCGWGAVRLSQGYHPTLITRPDGRHLIHVNYFCRIGPATRNVELQYYRVVNGIPINYLSRWLGHSSIQTTLIYLELVPDPTGSLAAVP